VSILSREEERSSLGRMPDAQRSSLERCTNALGVLS